MRAGNMPITSLCCVVASDWSEPPMTLTQLVRHAPEEMQCRRSAVASPPAERKLNKEVLYWRSGLAGHHKVKRLECYLTFLSYDHER